MGSTLPVQGRRDGAPLPVQGRRDGEHAAGAGPAGWGARCRCRAGGMGSTLPRHLELQHRSGVPAVTPTAQQRVHRRRGDDTNVDDDAGGGRGDPRAPTGKAWTVPQS
eukprot:gene45050-50878_t